MRSLQLEASISQLPLTKIHFLLSLLMEHEPTYGTPPVTEVILIIGS
jgi:hypothetical protein